MNKIERESDLTLIEYELNSQAKKNKSFGPPVAIQPGKEINWPGQLKLQLLLFAF